MSLFRISALAAVAAALFCSQLSFAEITDLRVDEPSRLPTVVFAFNCPVTTDQLSQVVESALEKRGIRSEVWRGQTFGYTAAAVCREHESGQHLFVLQFRFGTELEGDVKVAFVEQGYQVNAGIGGEAELLEEFAASLDMSLYDYVRQNIWD
ncbi:MAG: hypothetical protein AAGG11_10230 [Pseudomonadota bacterium]